MKNLIFCFDGTSNSPEDIVDNNRDESITNVLKLHLFFGGQLPTKHTHSELLSHQQSFYYSGIGTRGSWFKRLLNSAFAPPYGEMEDILAQAKSDLIKHYQDGDNIYIFGFSRGAAIARIFTSQLSLPVKFVGVFDTVAATRGSLDLNPKTFPASGIVFENDVLGQHVEKAVHLVAIDEQRLVFQPTLFNKDSRIKEVWFSGVHSDIGGGYQQDGLSDICLKFMLEEIKDQLIILPITAFNDHTLIFNNERFLITSEKLEIKPDALDILHYQTLQSKKSFLRAPRLIRVNVNEAASPFLPLVHYSVIERIRTDQFYRPEALQNKHYNVLNNKGNLSEIGFSFMDDSTVEKGLKQG
ncbi:hypothetical protein GCM10009111_33290 [Colwellia asteriadis]|uniref:T6SS Phospholipase effector Tle1-like catalytic domain-containing protein n=1 Tax=Colwellia asteriadis TaxID=517723 RepID=A0ABN1LAZ1_9GAMM